MFSVLFGLAGVAAIPAAIVAAEIYDVVTLLQSAVAIPPAFLCSIVAIVLGRRTRREAGRRARQSGPDPRLHRSLPLRDGRNLGRYVLRVTRVRGVKQLRLESGRRRVRDR